MDILLSEGDSVQVKEGDRLRIFAAGAYTTVYKSNFNNLKTIREEYLSLASGWCP